MVLDQRVAGRISDTLMNAPDTRSVLTELVVLSLRDPRAAANQIMGWQLGRDVLWTALALAAARGLQQRVKLYLCCADNMVSGNAFRLGDIIRYRNGKTVEVMNTDAEGRLTLADALVYTDKLGLDAIVDLATLTGANVIALGDDIAGLYTPDDALAGQLEQAASESGEKIWRMPLEEKYFEGLKSGIADMKNTGPRPGGSITAALFLKQFVKDTAWAHLDIAGPVWADKENGYNGPGATGYGVRLLVDWVLSE